MYKRLKILRKKNNITQIEISNFLKISRNLYSDYENGKKDVPLNILSLLAKFYSTSIDYIIEETDTFEAYPKIT